MSIDTPRAERLIIAAALAGLVLRLAFGLGYWVHRPLTHDEREYLALARNLSLGKGFTYDEPIGAADTLRFGRAPGYPVFLALVGAGTTNVDATPARVKIAQSLVGSLGVWLIGTIARRAGGPHAGVAAATIAAAYPPLVWICAYVFSEALSSTVALAAIVLLNRALDRKAASGNVNRSIVITAIAAGVTTGIAILIRPAIVFFIPIVVLWLAVRRRWVIAAMIVAGTIAIVGPWTLRNVHMYHRLVFVASEGGVTFWTGNHPLASGEGDMAANPAIKIADIEFRRQHPGLTPEELEPLYYRDAIDYIAAHPVWWLGLVLKKVFFTVAPLGRSYTLHSALYRVFSIASYLILLPFAAVGAAAWRLRPHPPEALFPLAASAILVCLLFFPQERFRIPIIDPTLIVCTGFWYGFRRMRQSTPDC
jgi:4-amino-4-deoxy-L-arabinose transferase-like glycosyltransferase